MPQSYEIIYRILNATAWRMDAPEMYGAFHLISFAVIIIAAVIFALRAKRLTDSGRIRLLAACGWVLVVMEVYKQLFLYFIVNQGAYDWWYFPFQLCSVPMYLCILLPVLCRKSLDINKPTEALAACITPKASAPYIIPKATAASSAVLTFLAGFTFIGALAALIVPADFLRSYVSLTLHGFIWHGILLFISLTVALSGMADFSRKGFARSARLFLFMCLIALAINILAEPVMAASYAEGLVPNRYAAMFYLNPYHISPQPIVDIVQKSAGIPLGLALYVLAIIFAAGITDLVFSRLVSQDRR